MNRKEKVAMIKEMLRLIALGSHNMPEYVFSYFVRHNVPYDQKCFFNLIADSFLTLYSFTVLMNDNCWSQAATLLRMGMEQVAAVFVISYNENALASYADLQKEKAAFALLDDNERKTYVKEHRIKGRENSYFDYSWCKELTIDKTYGRQQLLELAHLEEFLIDIDQTLNSFSHGSLTIFQFSKNNWDIMKKFGDRIAISCCKLFDFLCCSYKNLIKEEFLDLPLNDIFIRFKSIYEDLFEKEGWKN